MNHRKLNLILLAILIPLLAVAQDEMTFTYNIDGQTPEYFGFSRKERYDVAIKVVSPSLTGNVIKGLQVEFPGDPKYVSDVSGWLSNQLIIEKVGSFLQNVPDICTQSAKIKDGILTVEFSQPYVLTDAGVFVGYSFTVDNPSAEGLSNPVAVIKSNKTDGLWLHTSRSQTKWQNTQNKEDGWSSSMKVILSGSFAKNGAAATLPENLFGVAGEKIKVPLRVFNHGASSISTLQYSYSAGNIEDNATISFDPPIPSVYGYERDIEVVLPVPDTNGEFTVTLNIDKVNGYSNEDVRPNANSFILAMPFMPIKRILVEEFTGMGCGYCPRGYVAMEYLKEKYPDIMVPMVYHSSAFESRSALVTMNEHNFPVHPNNFPDGYIDRKGHMDPGAFIVSWNDYGHEMPEADLDIDFFWADKEHTSLCANIDTRFIRDYSNADFKLSVALTADGLTSPDYVQANYFSGEETEKMINDFGGSQELWDIFTKGPSIVQGLEFNDVVVFFRNTTGISGSVPTEIKAGQPNRHTWTVLTDYIMNLAGEKIVDDFTKTHVVAIITDKDGNVVNCKRSSSPKEFSDNNSGIPITTTSDIVNIIWHDMTGRRVEEPVHGIYMKTEIHSDGSSYTKKILKAN